MSIKTKTETKGEKKCRLEHPRTVGQFKKVVIVCSWNTRREKNSTEEMNI